MQTPKPGQRWIGWEKLGVHYPACPKLFQVSFKVNFHFK